MTRRDQTAADDHTADILRAGANRREYERTPLALHASYRTSDSDAEPAAVVIDISPGGARLRTATAPPVGTEINLNILGLGSLGGRVVRAEGADFSVQFTNCAVERERLATEIAWHFNRSRLGQVARFGAERDGLGRCDLIEFQDGSRFEAEIVDLSISRVAFKCSRQVLIGERIRIGAQSGGVVGRIVGGFTVAFDPPAA